MNYPLLREGSIGDLDDCLNDALMTSSELSTTESSSTEIFYDMDDGTSLRSPVSRSKTQAYVDTSTAKRSIATLRPQSYDGANIKSKRPQSPQKTSTTRRCKFQNKTHRTKREGLMNRLLAELNKTQLECFHETPKHQRKS